MAVANSLSICGAHLTTPCVRYIEEIDFLDQSPQISRACRLYDRFSFPSRLALSLRAFRKHCLERKPPHPRGTGFHVAFSAPNHAAVTAFWDAAIGTGATDRGKPDLRDKKTRPESYIVAYVWILMDIIWRLCSTERNNC